MDDRHLNDAMRAVIEAAAEAITAGFFAASDRHDDSRECAGDIRDGVAMQALLGNKLSKLLLGMTEGVQRKTVERFAQYRDHPRMTREQLIDEAESADLSLNRALVAHHPVETSSLKRAVPGIELWTAIIRVRAITQVIGADCIYPARTNGKKPKAERHRRREITAADLSRNVTALVVALAEGDETAKAQAHASLYALQTEQANHDGIITKILAIMAMPDGPDHLGILASRINRAHGERSQSNQSSNIVRIQHPAPIAPSPATSRPSVSEPAVSQPAVHRPRSAMTVDQPPETTLSVGVRAAQMRGARPPSKLSVTERLQLGHEKTNGRKP